MITADDLKAARKAMGETHEAFSRRFGVDRSTYSGWEKGGPPKEGTAPLLIERVLAELGQLPTTEAAE
jgi:transcriptional regulator with XRE-family HTH domain